MITATFWLGRPLSAIGGGTIWRLIGRHMSVGKRKIAAKRMSDAFPNTSEYLTRTQYVDYWAAGWIHNVRGGTKT